MDQIKGLAEIAEHVLYETLALFIPGCVVAAAVAMALGGNHGAALLAFAEEHSWFCVLGAYVLGYPIQGLSRPATTAFEWVLRLPARAVFALLRSAGASKALQWLDSLERTLSGKHLHPRSREGEGSLTTKSLCSIYWATRLGLPAGKILGDRQTQDLSFSALLSERQRLDRFRAAASLARGVSVGIVAGFSILLGQLPLGIRPPSYTTAGVLLAFVVAFYGFMQRADLYDDLWRSAWPAQFLCAVTKDNPLSIGEETPDVPGTDLRKVE